MNVLVKTDSTAIVSQIAPSLHSSSQVSLCYSWLARIYAAYHCASFALTSGRTAEKKEEGNRDQSNNDADRKGCIFAFFRRM